MVTSSAVVGSSAMTHVGVAGERHRDQRALAQAARELVRIVADALVGLGDADRVEQLDRLRARAVRRVARPCTSSVSSIWLPMVKTGFSAVIGSWKISAISRAAHALHLALRQRAAGRGP